MSPEGLPDNLDPARNPMIQIPAPEPEPGKFLPDDSGLAPMQAIGLTPEAIAEKLAKEFPGPDMVRIDENMTLLKSAAGTFATDRGYSIADLPTEDLARIAAFLAGRGK